MKKRKLEIEEDRWNKHLEDKLISNEIPRDITKLVEDYADWTGWIRNDSRTIYLLTSTHHVDCYKRAETTHTNEGAYRSLLEPCKIAISKNMDRLFEHLSFGEDDDAEEENDINAFLEEFYDVLKLKSKKINEARMDKIDKKIENINSEDVLCKMHEYLVSVIEAKSGEFTSKSSGSCWNIEAITVS